MPIRCIRVTALFLLLLSVGLPEVQPVDASEGGAGSATEGRVAQLEEQLIEALSGAGTSFASPLPSQAIPQHPTNSPLPQSVSEQARTRKAAPAPTHKATPSPLALAPPEQPSVNFSVQTSVQPSEQASETLGLQAEPERCGVPGAVPMTEAVRSMCARLEGPNALYAKDKAEGASRVLCGHASGLPAWSPQPNRFLVAACSSGRLSNRIACLVNSVIVAGLLNRTLVVPSGREPARGRYNQSEIASVDHLRRCFGPSSAVSSGELLRQRSGVPLPLDLFFCVFPPQGPRQRRFCKPYWEAYAGLLQLPAIYYQEFGPIDFPQLTKLIRDDKLSSIPTVMLGDLFLLNSILPPSYLGSGDAPFARSPACPNSLAVYPIPSFVDGAVGLLRSAIGDAPFLGFHWRRGDLLLKYCSTESERAKSKGSCLGWDETATSLAHFSFLTGLRRMVICSDSRNWDEINQLLIALKERASVEVVLNPEPDGAFLDEAERKVFFMSVQKLILAHSAVFIGTPKSTFSKDIERLRIGLGMAHCLDAFL